MRFAAIDLGGSFIKSAVGDLETGELLHAHRTAFPAFAESPDPSFREVDVAVISREFDTHVRRLLDLETGCTAIFVSTQMHGFVLGDRYVSWQDQRSVQHAYGEFTARLDEDALARIGNEVGPGHAATVLFAMGGAAAGQMPLPLPNALVGSHTADETLAASFGVYDLRKRAWDESLIATLGLNAILWPRITRWHDVVGNYRVLAVYSPIGDQQAALIGADLAASELSVNIGTGSQVSMRTEEFRSGPFKIRPYPWGGFLATITHIPAGRALRNLKEVVNLPWSEIDAAVDALSGTDLEVDLSFYPGSFGSRGRISNIHDRTLTPAHIFLAAYECMAKNYAAAAWRLVPDGKWGSLVLSGGLAHRVERLRSLVRATLGGPFRLSASPEETLRGLSKLAKAGLAGAM